MDKLLAEYDRSRNVELFEQLVTEEAPITSWDEFQRWLEPFQEGGCFRGHRDAKWDLVTTLDRALLKTLSVETAEVNCSVREKLNPTVNEANVLLEFQRAAHNFDVRTPANEDLIDWLALMQHYGAPTRLLDWTLSLCRTVLRYAGRFG